MKCNLFALILICVTLSLSAQEFYYVDEYMDYYDIVERKNNDELQESPGDYAEEDEHIPESSEYDRDEGEAYDPYALTEQKVDYFEGDLIALKKEAKESKKPYIVKFYTSWCVQCRKMDFETLNDNNVSNYLNQHTLTISLDAETNFDGLSLAQQYGVKSYPTILVFDYMGRLRGRFVGMYSPTYFLRELKKYTS